MLAFCHDAFVCLTAKKEVWKWTIFRTERRSQMEEEFAWCSRDNRWNNTARLAEEGERISSKPADRRDMWHSQHLSPLFRVQGEISHPDSRRHLLCSTAGRRKPNLWCYRHCLYWLMQPPPLLWFSLIIELVKQLCTNRSQTVTTCLFPSPLSCYPLTAMSLRSNWHAPAQ